MKKQLVGCTILFASVVVSAVAQPYANTVPDGETWYKVNTRGKHLVQISTSGSYAVHNLLVFMISGDWDTAEFNVISEYNYNHLQVAMAWGYVGEGPNRYLVLKSTKTPNATTVSGFTIIDVTNPSTDFQLEEVIDTSAITLIGPKPTLHIAEHQARIGIGTTEPTEKLDVNGNIKAKSIHLKDVHNTINLEGFGFGINSDRGHLFRHWYTPDFGDYVEINNQNAAGAGGGRVDYILRISGTEGFQFIPREEEAMRVNRFGNVGIGTIAPVEKLEVNGLIKIPSANAQDNNSPGIVAVSNDDFLYAGEYLNHYGLGFHTYQDASSNYNGNNAYVAGYFGVDLFTGGQNRLRVNRDGKIGIGTTDPSAKLTVDGDILAEKVKVVTSVEAVPDYVFKEDYELRSLEEVANYVKTNRHLPEVPSAEEIAADGHNFAKMNLLLLKKIEELTLYVIEQNQKIVALEEEVQSGDK